MKKVEDFVGNFPLHAKLWEGARVEKMPLRALAGLLFQTCLFSGYFSNSKLRSWEKRQPGGTDMQLVLISEGGSCMEYRRRIVGSFPKAAVSKVRHVLGVGKFLQLSKLNKIFWINNRS